MSSLLIGDRVIPKKAIKPCKDTPFRLSPFALNLLQVLCPSCLAGGEISLLQQQNLPSSITPFPISITSYPKDKSTSQCLLANKGIPLISLFAFVALGNAPVQSISPLPSVVPLPKSAILPIASANFPFHFPWLSTNPLNSLPTVGCTANFASLGRI
jgi:hypothetical protein